MTAQIIVSLVFGAVVWYSFHLLLTWLVKKGIL